MEVKAPVLPDTGKSAKSSASIPESGHQAPSQTTQAVQDILFGSIAGIIGKFVEYPFDTVKVRLQSQSTSSPLQYKGPWDCFQQSFRHDGFRSLYRGISAPLIGAAVETSSLFFSYRLAQTALQATIYSPDRPLTMPALLVCGAASGAVTSLLLTPIELVKCKMQVPSIPSLLHPSSITPPPIGPVKIITSIFRHQGILGFWHGQLGTLIRETGGSAAWFGSYEGVKLLFRNYLPPTPLPTSSTAFQGQQADERQQSLSENTPFQPLYQKLLAGAVAGMSYNFAFYPADTIKSRMQTTAIPSSSSTRPAQNFLTVGRELWLAQGLRGLYRGCGITVARAAPSSAIIFALFETLKGGLG